MTIKLTLLGTGCPIPTSDRAETSQVVSVNNELLLFDCGGGAMTNLVRAGVDPVSINRVFFTHHHFDHNADFAYFALTSWVMGRKSLHVYGPRGTGSFVDSLFKGAFKADIESRTVLQTSEGIADIQVSEFTEGQVCQGKGWEVTALRVIHPLDSVAFRLDSAHHSLVISGDTGYYPPLASFARGANVLVQECTMSLPFSQWAARRTAGRTDKIDASLEKWWSKLSKIHCTPSEAAQIAQEAQVDTLVLTHFLPRTDPGYVADECGRHFQGQIIIGEDLLEIEC